jgi:hypothetical protein
LTPSARSANLTPGDGTKNGLPAPNKELSAKTKNNDLTGKAPYKFESPLLERGVHCELTFGGASLSIHASAPLDTKRTAVPMVRRLAAGGRWIRTSGSAREEIKNLGIPLEFN